MSENLAVAIILSTCACTFGWVVWVIAVNIRRSRSGKQIAELHSRLLDRFAGNQELIGFLEGESGRRYFDALEYDAKNPLNRILAGIQLGVVLILLGISLVVVRSVESDEVVRNTLLLIGVPGIALGVGFLISAVISHRLCKSWGLLDKNRRQVS
jgi:heme/copper-type cytochrome/quinol oxidase subunit 1